MCQIRIHNVLPALGRSPHRPDGAEDTLLGSAELSGGQDANSTERMCSGRLGDRTSVDSTGGLLRSSATNYLAHKVSEHSRAAERLACLGLHFPG